MADVCSNVPAAASPSKCREARRRRIQMRRSSSASDVPTDYKRRAAASSSSASGKRRNTEIGVSSPQSPSPHPPLPPPQSTSSSASASSSGGSALGCGDDPSRDTDSETEDPPRFGWISVPGRSREMEDALTVLPHFLSPEDPFHFFGVFDGHGGSHVSALCRDRMHAYLAEELRAGRQDCGEDMWRGAMARSFIRMDVVAMSSCACGRVGTSPPCTCERSGMPSEIVGSTAVVAVVGPRKIVVANCGDSRAVLSRGGRAIPLSNDHKPDRADELERIEAAGGRVIHLNGGARVLGILAMSRAIGDRYLKPPVISDPEVTITDRTPEDECLIIASDGLWDVLSNDLACDIARHCLKDGAHLNEAEEPSSGSSDARCMLAATLLTRLALGRMCLDNISVIVVDLQKYQRYQGCK